MAAQPIPRHILLETVRAYKKYGTKAEAARQTNTRPSTFDHRLEIAEQIGEDVLEAEERFEELGYTASSAEMTPEEAWDSHTGAFERTLARNLEKRKYVIKRPSGPFAIAHFTDEHLDDNATPLKLLEEDISITHDMDAVRLHGGDVINNWPLMGRLAKKWAEQQCTAPEALLRAEHFFALLKPEAAVHGNHEEMNAYLSGIMRSYMPDDCFVDDWTVSFSIKAGSAAPYKVRMSHKYQKGSSWFHKTHGHIREMLEVEHVDLLVDGHLHCAGVMYHELPERGESSLLVASAGYKMMDRFATRISRGGVRPKLRGRAHWIVVDPSAEYAGDKHIAFKDPRRALHHLNSLQNKTEV